MFGAFLEQLYKADNEGSGEAFHPTRQNR